MNAAADFAMDFLGTVAGTVFDVAPIVAILVIFQVVVLRQRPPNLRGIVTGFVCVLLGLALFLIGLEQALFPIGETMARQLTEASVGGASPEAGVDWRDYALVYVFAAAIGFATTVAEPPLIAVALKAEQVSGGAVSAWGLRIAVAIGVAVGVSLGCFRIVTGTPLPWYIIAAYVVVIVQTFRAGKTIIPLAYDCGGVTTSTVTRAGRGGARPRPRGQRAGTQPVDRRVRADCFRECVPHHVRTGVCDGRGLGEGWAHHATLATPTRPANGGFEAMRMKLIVALVSDDKTESVIEAARAGGATGVTIVTSARGEGITPKRSFFGLDLTAHGNVVLFLVVETRARDILERIRGAGRFDEEPGSGVAFQIAVEDAVGLSSQLSAMREELEEEL